MDGAERLLLERAEVVTLLMVVEIALFGVLMAGVSTYFVQGAGEPDEDVGTADLVARLEALEPEIGELSGKTDAEARGENRSDNGHARS